MNENISKHGRNLNTLSVIIICFWVLGLEPTGDQIKFLSLEFKMRNKEFVYWVAGIIYMYYFWRYWLVSKGIVISSFRNHLSISGNQYKGIGKFGKYIIRKMSKNNFLKNHKKDYLDRHKKNRLKEIPKDLKVSGKSIYRSLKNQNSDQDQKEKSFIKNIIKLFTSNKRYVVVYNCESKIMGDDLQFKFDMPFRWRFVYKPYRWISYCFGLEDSPTYLIPYILFLTAVFCSLMNYLGFDFYKVVH